MKELELGVKKVYKSFFKNMKIDSNGFFIDQSINMRFSTYPYIGSNYGEGNIPKILFVGLDVGIDNGEEEIEAFLTRRKNIEVSWNPHIAGTYMTALFFLKDYFSNLNKIWNDNKEQNYRYIDSGEFSNIPLNYISLTNMHKFVVIGKEQMQGNENRNFINRELEESLLIDEINLFDPDIVIFQSTSFLTHYNDLIKKLIDNKNIFIGFHPSKPGIKNSIEFIQDMNTTTETLYKNIIFDELSKELVENRSFLETDSYVYKSINGIDIFIDNCLDWGFLKENNRRNLVSMLSKFKSSLLKNDEIYQDDFFIYRHIHFEKLRNQTDRQKVVSEISELLEEFESYLF